VNISGAVTNAVALVLVHASSATTFMQPKWLGVW
jgi:hypothetical protein